MSEDGGGNEDRRPGWEFDDHLEIPEDEMAALGVVVLAECGDGTQAKGKVEVVEVDPGAGLGAQVERNCSEDVIDEVAAK